MEKVTFEQVESAVKCVEYDYKGKSATICTVTLHSGWTSVGIASCADESWYSQELGEEWSYKDAIGKLIPMITYLRYHTEPKSVKNKLQVEYWALMEKLNKLNAALKNKDLDVDQEHKELLELQQHHMTQYAIVLTQRMDILKE